MKLATLKNGTRDGQLAVVSRDLTRAIVVGDRAPTMQAALDDWQRVAPQLTEIAVALDAGGAGMRHAIPFDPRQAHAPLPRAYQWVDGSAYVNHVELVRKARGAAMPPEFWTDPLMYQGGSDSCSVHRMTSCSRTNPGVSISRPRSPLSSAMYPPA